MGMHLWWDRKEEQRTILAARREHGNNHEEVLLGQPGAGLAVLPLLGVWSLLESNSSKRCGRRCDRKGDLLFSQKQESTVVRARSKTFGEWGLLLSLCSFLPPTLISATFSRDKDIFISPREGVKNELLCSWISIRMINMCEISIGFSLIECFCFAYFFMWWLHNLKYLLHFLRGDKSFIVPIFLCFVSSKPLWLYLLCRTSASRCISLQDRDIFCHQSVRSKYKLLQNKCHSSVTFSAALISGRMDVNCRSNLWKLTRPSEFSKSEVACELLQRQFLTVLCETSALSESPFWLY